MKYPFTKCVNPHIYVNRYTHQEIEVSCGVCKACLMNRANKMTMLCSIEESEHKYCMFFTLTYSDEYVPMARPHIDNQNNVIRYVSVCDRLMYASANENQELGGERPDPPEAPGRPDLGPHGGPGHHGRGRVCLLQAAPQAHDRHQRVQRLPLPAGERVRRPPPGADELRHRRARRAEDAEGQGLYHAQARRGGQPGEQGHPHGLRPQAHQTTSCYRFCST